jgi:hypothetical protein
MKQVFWLNRDNLGYCLIGYLPMRYHFDFKSRVLFGGKGNLKSGSKDTTSFFATSYFALHLGEHFASSFLPEVSALAFITAASLSSSDVIAPTSRD